MTDTNKNSEKLYLHLFSYSFQQKKKNYFTVTYDQFNTNYRPTELMFYMWMDNDAL